MFKRVFHLFKTYFHNRELTEGQGRYWDTVIKFFGVAGAIVAFFWGIEEFKIKSERDFRKDFYLEQIKIMNETVDIVSTLSTAADTSAGFKDAEANLNKLEAGKIYLFADQQLIADVTEFFYSFKIYKTGSATISRGNLTTISTKIANHCESRIKTLTLINND